MTQLVTRVDETVVAAIDELIEDGVVASRSEAVRRGLGVLLEQVRRRRTAEAIVRGYEAKPQTENEMVWEDEATIQMIAGETW